MKESEKKFFGVQPAGVIIKLAARGGNSRS